MAPEPAGHRVGAELTGDKFGFKRVVFSVGAMSGTARRLLRKRLGSELDVVRDLIRKAELFPSSDPSGEAGAAGRFTAAKPHPEASMEVGSSSEAKRRKVSSLVQRTEERKRTTPDERARLAERLSSLAAALPDHVVAFLQDQRAEGDADYHGDGSETEAGTNSIKDGALFQLKLLLDKVAPESTPENIGRAALDASRVSCLSQHHHHHHHHHQDASGKIVPVDKEGDVVGICGSGSSRRIQLRDIAEEYGDLVDSTGVLLLSPLPRKLVDIAERDEYVDICGDASPVVFPAAKAVKICSSPSSSSSRSGASSSDSDTSSSDSDTSSSDSDTSSSDSDSGSDSDESVGSRPPPPDFRKEGSSSEKAVQSPKPVPEKMQIASSPPAPLAVPKGNDISARLPESAPEEAVQIAKPEKLRNQCNADVLALEVRPTTTSPPAPLALFEGNDTFSQPPESAPEAVHSVEPEEPQNERAAVTEPTVRSMTTSPPAPAALPNENDTSAQPPPPAPDAASTVIVEPEEEPQDPSAAPAPAADDPPTVTDLIAKAQEAMERRRQEEMNRAREKARRELVEVERAALPDERIRPLDMELLGIAAFEHIVGTVDGAARAAQPTRENSGVAPASCPTVMQLLGLFLKADDGGEEGEIQ